jgi:hypothetical protein
MRKLRGVQANYNLEMKSLKLRNIIYILACLIVILAGEACGAGPISESRIAAPSVLEPTDGAFSPANAVPSIMPQSTDGALSQDNAEPGTQLTLLNSEVVSKPVLAANFASLKKSNKSMTLASDFLVKKGFVPLTKDENFFGINETYSVKSNTTGEETQETFTLMVQDYRSKSNNDLGAVGRVIVVAGNERQVYTFSLIAPDGNFQKAVEYQVTGTQAAPTNLQVIKANSWWSCVVQQIKDKCACVCILSLFECSGTWSQYLSCVGSKCGGCLAKASLCCACNCSWWCKKAVGCCHR